MNEFKIVEEKHGDHLSYHININGKRSYFSYIENKSSRHVRINEKDKAIIELIKNCSLKEIQVYLDHFSFHEEIEILDCTLYFSFFLEKGRLHHPSHYSYPFIFISPSFDFRHWNKPYTGAEMHQKFAAMTATFSEVEFYEDEAPDPFFGINIPIDINTNVNDALLPALNSFSQIYSRTISELNSSSSEGISSLFEFPEEIKAACLQYLSYFSQFLLDLGINADTSIRENANKIIFTVTPRDKTEALEKIKLALDVFLSSPGNSYFNSNTTSQNKDIAAIQFEANIYHLRSQLALAQAVLQAKDATIDAMKLSNFKLQEIVMGQIDGRNIDHEEEKIFGGLVSLKQYEGKGFSIDIAKLFRLLKRKFRR